jgi:hypothetical protein
MVREVSAILVDMMIFLPVSPFLFLEGGGSKIRCYKWGGRVE